MNYQAINYEKKDFIGHVVLNRPQVLNAINAQMRKELVEVFSVMEGDPEVRAVIMSGAGERAFSGGADIKEFGTRPVEETRTGWDKVGNLFGKPVIAAVHGFCVGGALQMVLKCDIIIASEDAQFGLPEIDLGIMVSDGGTQRLVRLIGPNKTLEMVLTGGRITAQEAYNFGLINKVVPREELMPLAQKMAKSIANKDSRLVQYYKEAVYRGRDLPLEAGLELERDLAKMAKTEMTKGRENHKLRQ